MDSVIVAKDVSKVFETAGERILANDAISFEARRGELVIILGPSGAGKSTLLNIIGGMDTPSSGQLLVNGVDISHYDRRQLTQYRRNDVGFVFQFYNLMSNLTALENVELATELKKDSMPPREALQLVGLGERMNNFPAQLSGGEQQRVSIARALAKNSSILLCDEPTGALDYQTGKQILALLADAAHKQGRTTIIVTHNAALKDMGDRVIRLKNGRIESNVVNPEPKPIEEIEW